MRPLRDQHVKPKANATFKCELFKDTPNWKWFKGDQEIPNDPTDKTEIKKVGKDMVLTIKNAQPNDIAEYTLEVEGKRYSAKLTLGGGCYMFFLLFNFIVTQSSAALAVVVHWLVNILFYTSYERPIVTQVKSNTTMDVYFLSLICLPCMILDCGSAQSKPMRTQKDLALSRNRTWATVPSLLRW